MRRRIALAITLLVLTSGAPRALYAALPPAGSAGFTVTPTFYAPGASGWMQGPMTAARPNVSGTGNLIYTLDDLRLGKTKYITLASASSMAGRWFCLGTVQYASPLDRKVHVLTNVVGYIHDTGCAFNGTCTCQKLPQYCSGQSRPDKMDIPVGNFNGWDALTAANFVSKNPNKTATVWQQISGLPSGTPTGSTAACGGIPQETGIPIAAPYSPTQTYNNMPPTGMYTGVPSNSYGAPFSNLYSSPMGASTYGNQMGTGMPILTPSNSNQAGQGSGSVGITDVYTPPTSGQQEQNTTSFPPTSLIIAQPSIVLRGFPIIVSWTSVGMQRCTVVYGSSVLAGTKSGTRVASSNAVNESGGLAQFALQCETASGEIEERRAQVIVLRNSVDETGYRAPPRENQFQEIDPMAGEEYIE